MISSPELDAWASAQLSTHSGEDWVLREHGYDPHRESAVESRFAVSNGFLGVRGARAASRAATWVSWIHHLSWASWPRTFVAGLFDTPNTEPAVPALVPAPDWLRFRVVVDRVPLVLRTDELIAHHRTLEMRRGLMNAEWTQCIRGERTMHLRTLRLVSMADRHLGVQVVQLEFSHAEHVTLEAWLEVTNAGLEVVQVQPALGVWRTATSRKYLAIASAGDLLLDGRSMEPTGQVHLTRIWDFDAPAGQRVTFCRLVSFARAGEASEGPARCAERSLRTAASKTLPEIVSDHEARWAERWWFSDVQVDTDDAEVQRSLRFAIYHLNSAANPEDEFVSIGARALTGDGYLGHVFWDTENYVLPFFTCTWPAAARALLMYRLHTLPAARAKAARMGYRGALYAWESADTGEETTPETIIGPDGRPLRVLCGIEEQHISADVAYAVWQYWQATHDVEFLLRAGAEIIVETARFWASRARLEDDGHFHIRGVIGPDEYHETIDDNAYTNTLARWNVERGLETLRLLTEKWPQRHRELVDALGLDSVELAHWRSVADRLVTGLDSRTGRIEQFAGYFQLEDIDLSQYAGRTVPMDVVLGRERVQASQVLKQADVVMLLALLPDAFHAEVQRTNFAYYEPRCGHGSSLSRAMHAIVAARLGQVDLAYRYFRETAATDSADNADGLAGGVHIAALGGLWQAAVFGFGGFTPDQSGVSFAPRLPASWRRLQYRVQWRGRLLHADIDAARESLIISLERGGPMDISVGGETHSMQSGEVWRVRIPDR